MKVGISVYCVRCLRQKQPRGRSAPIGLMMCNRDTCGAYDSEPRVGDLWPRESEEDFGYPVSADGTIEAGEQKNG